MLLKNVEIRSQNHCGNMPVINEAGFLPANQQDSVFVVLGVKHFFF